MKAFAVFRKSIRQQARDRAGLALTLLTAPFFVFFYWAVFPEGPQPIDACASTDEATFEAVVQTLESVGSPVELRECDEVEAEIVAAAPDFTDEAKEGSGRVDIRGDASTAAFGVAARDLRGAFEERAAGLQGRAPPVVVSIEATGASDEMSDFDLYVPNLLIFAVIMLVFSSAMSLAREIERGTLERMRLTQMRTTDYLVGMSATQTLLGLGSIAATFGVALLLGFEAAGSPVAAAGVALLTAVACIGVGTLVASFSRTVAQAFVIASFFMFLLVLFSGIVFPIPDSIGFELIPTVHGARAMHDILVLDVPLAEMPARLATLTGLAALVFALAGLRFRQLHRSFLGGERTS